MSDQESPKEEEKVKPLNEGLFVGSRDPNWTLDHEKPWHRIAAYFFAMGDTISSVARKTGHSQPAVNNLLRQGWFQKLVTTLMAEAGVKDINKIFRAEELNNYSVITGIRDDPNTPAAIKLRAAMDMLDRSMGKATTRIEVSHETVSDDPVKEFQRLEDENNRLKKEISEL